MSHVWEVMGIEHNNVLIRKLPAEHISCQDAHQFAAFGRAHVCSVCQMRKQPIVDFLPKREDKARAHVIVPSSALLAPQPYTVYGYRLPNGEVRTTHITGGNWDKTLPVIPSLAIIWTIPESLRAMVSGRYEGPENPSPTAPF